MSAKKSSEVSARVPPSATQSAPLAAAQSSSVPSTPHQHPRKYSFESREHSPGATQNHSPRSAYSETNGNVPSLRPLPPRLGGCRFETAVPHSRRRMPYSLGTDRLENVSADKVKSKLSDEEEAKLETHIQELFGRLLPTDAIENNRRKLVSKLEKLFNDEWPGHDIRVNLFGSSGNLLCSDDSDVDICITTPWRELESVCLIADLLQRHGMEKVVCVSSAKVPIVKIWDPELSLACDMNVNNTLALENTRMVRTYVSIDDRVRPLAIIIKYWTRRRIINDAAFGGTLSSYTWICMIIAFLQLREPPVLPALHQRHNLKLVKPDGTRSEFADDIPKLRGFGAKNKDSLATLLFQFFRFYAHEFDYDKHALSIRTGRLLTKTEKKWHIGSNNALCIEEPFNTIRNLGNTADDTSFRGLHMELRRAFDLIAEGKFEQCCEEYVFPKEEERIWQKPAPAPRPILVRSASQQHGGGGRSRGGFRGNRQFHRNNNANRRGSSGVGYENNQAFTQGALPPTLSTQDLLWYQAQSPQLSVPQELLNTSLNALAAQETMRFHLYTQLSQQQVLAHAQRMQQNGQTNDRSRTNSFDNPPLTAPIRPELMYSFGFPIQPSPYFHPGFTTYPSTPATAAPTANGQSEYRRSLHRNAAASDAGTSPGSGSLRSQSQPASRTPITSQSMAGYSTSSQSYNGVPAPQSRQVNGVHMTGFIPDEASDLGFDDASAKAISDSPPQDDGPRYVGYYVSDYPSQGRQANGFLSNGTPSNGNASGEPSQNGQGGGGRRRLSTDQLPQSVLDRRMKRTSRSPSPMGHARNMSVGVNSAPLLSTPFNQINGKLPSKPLVVNGTAPKTASTAGSAHPAVVAESPATNGTNNHDNALHIQGASPSSSWPEPQTTPSPSSAEPVATPVSQRPVIVNGSSTNRSPSAMPNMMDVSFQQRIAMGPGPHLPYSAVAGDPNNLAGFSRIHTRQQLAPLDLAMGDFAVHQELPHLSPVYEHRTPSPTVARRFEPSPIAQAPGLPSMKEYSKPSHKTSNHSNSRSPNGSSARQQQHQQDSATRSPVHDHRINGLARENGHVRAAKSQTESFSPWQKSKSRKKGVADLKHAAANSNGGGNGNGLSSHSEPPPKNDADRKGG
ncbi:hypothetical protein B0I37DRAFT_410866 [Chaetomium sp. MPI-CAGE-AT-0009]|nr:hypothetical protein B0I37DRAFT_410866 [Chaetomium sp. MPI-CAGE-AT-0009]